MKYLDLKGLQYYTGKVQTEIDSAKGEVNSALQNHILNGSNPHNVTKDQVGLANVTNDAQVKRSEMGVANGVATLNESGTIPSAQLPSYVDDVLEYDNKSAFPPSGEAGKIYVAKDTNLTYRWSGSAYVEISQSLALGETSSTAYAGDKGAANRAAINSLPSSIISNVAIGDITGTSVGLNITKANKSGLNYDAPAGSVLNIPAATGTAAGLMTAADKAKLNGLNADPIQSFVISNHNHDSTHSLTYEFIINTDHTAELTLYSAGMRDAGLMSASDFSKLMGIEAQANRYILPAATASTLGGVKVGSDLSITADGVLSVNAETISNTDIDSLFT